MSNKREMAFNCPIKSNTGIQIASASEDHLTNFKNEDKKIIYCKEGAMFYILIYVQKKLADIYPNVNYGGGFIILIAAANSSQAYNLI